MGRVMIEVDWPSRKFQTYNLVTEATMITYWNKAARKNKQTTGRTISTQQLRNMRPHPSAL